MPQPRYKRLLLKLSGEALMGDGQGGIDIETTQQIVSEIIAARDAGCAILIVVGGGNIFRGMKGVASGMERTSADYMGMLATAMNGLALKAVFEGMGAHASVYSAFPLGPAFKNYSRDGALADSEAGEFVIFVAGTGNPFFTTDTTAALRAIEMDCDVMVKATQVDGIYSADPKKNPDAIRYDILTYGEVLEKNLNVMDATAIALSRDNGMPVLVYALGSETSLTDIVEGRGRFTLVEAG